MKFEENREKFLIIRLGAIGDIVHCLPVADFLKNNFPNCQIDWVVDEKYEQLLNNNPLIDNCYSVPLSKWKKSWLKLSTIKEISNFNKILQKERYSWAFDLHGMFKSLVIFAFCGAKKRAGYSDYREFAPLGANVLVKPKSKRPHTNYHIIQRNLDLISGSGLLTSSIEKKVDARLPKATPECVEKIDELLIHLDKSKPTYVFAPATTWVNKHWNIGEWQKLYELTKKEANIVFSGTQKDLSLIYAITKKCRLATVLAGKTNLEDYIEILRRADIVVSPDSSASHLAFALQCENRKPNIITIFCATSKNTFAPLGEENVAFPSQNPVCTPCFKRKCKFKHQNCTSQTTAKEVYAAIKNAIEKLLIKH